ncbi:MAG: hypothetical protein NT099_09135 [Candidatus Saganbacteria bacterium]|nr:hypothetical protein [Candidatus Saganbacteria bacterium]
MKTQAPGQKPAVGVPGPEAARRLHPDIRWDKALQKASGIVYAARVLGANLGRDFVLSPGTFAAFQKAIEKIEDQSVELPFIIAGAASISGQASGKTVYEFPDHMDAQKALEESFFLLSCRLENVTKGTPYDPTTAYARFAEKSWKNSWATARDAAATVEDGMEVQIKVGNEHVMAIGEKGPVFVQLVGESGNVDPLPWTSFYISRGTLGEDTAFAEFEVPGGGSVAGLSFDASALLARLKTKPLPEIPGTEHLTAPSETQAKTLSPFIGTVLPASTYPNRDVVRRAELHQVVAVLPYPAGLGRLQFQLSVPLMETPVLLEVITGEGWHTKHGQFQFPASKGGMGTVKIPDSFGGSSFFKGESDADISARRGEQADRTGDLISKRAVIVLKPGISPSLASLRRKLLCIDTLKDYEVQMLGDELMQTLTFDPLFFNDLKETGLFTDPQLAKLGEIVQAARGRKERRDAEDRALSSFRSMSLLSYGGDSLMRGGGLHVGVGDFAGALGRAHQSYEPDPFASPVVYAVYPYGVAEQTDLQPDIAAGVALANNVVSLWRK